eukprot:scaffold110416_cov29-Tisochrysis_lutea.AAC.4
MGARAVGSSGKKARPHPALLLTTLSRSLPPLAWPLPTISFVSLPPSSPLPRRLHSLFVARFHLPLCGLTEADYDGVDRRELLLLRLVYPLYHARQPFGHEAILVLRHVEEGGFAEHLDLIADREGAQPHARARSYARGGGEGGEGEQQQAAHRGRGRRGEAEGGERRQGQRERKRGRREREGGRGREREREGEKRDKKKKKQEEQQEEARRKESGGLKKRFHREGEEGREVPIDRQVEAYETKLTRLSSPLMQRTEARGSDTRRASLFSSL